ncbi:MAG: DUF1592 domain-containing protein, partial [Moritella sp.]|uniref:DUF1592 domain-containing protein n=1 Tax=Moritella sp. TaxID=78556 RepID=UPI001E08AE7A
TMPPTPEESLCIGQCAVDVAAFIMSWDREHNVAECLQSDADKINYGPRQLRLLTSAEYVNTVKTLFGYDVDLALLPKDDQIHFFSNHAKTSLNSTRLDAFESIAKKIVTYSEEQDFSNVLGFDEGFTDGVARRAFRRPLNGAEKAGYITLEASDTTVALQALLISPYFLFRSELGMTSAEFIDFNENSEPVYKFVGEPTVITDVKVNGSVRADSIVKLYETAGFNFDLTGRDLVIIRVKAMSAPGPISQWPKITPVINHTAIAGYEDGIRIESEKFKNYSFMLEGLTGNVDFMISADDSGNHPNGEPYDRHLEIESVTVAAAQQVVFQVPNIDAGSFALTPYEMATFIAYTYTGNTPDDILLDAANEGFADEAAIRTQIERLMATPAAKVHFGAFVDQWLMTDGVLSVAKDTDLFPGFTQEVREAMHQEAREIFIDVIFNETGFTSLFDSNDAFVNNVLADFYGITGVPGSGFKKVQDSSRGGLLTTGAFLASQASPIESHLIKRAVRIRERVMCQHLPPFPTDVNLDTIRAIQAQKVEDKKAENDGLIRQAHLDYINTDVEACKGCHEYIINPLGVALEDYDAVGLPRTQYADGLSVDLTGFDANIEQHNAHLYGIDDLYEINDGVILSGTKSLGQILANQDVTRECLQEMAFRFIMDTGPDQFDHADKTKIELAPDELVNYACAMDSMNQAMKVEDSPREAFINLGLSEIVRFRKVYNRISVNDEE